MLLHQDFVGASYRLARKCLLENFNRLYYIYI
jgi:ethanolamine utilization cobalamin adenosyltransferase